MQNEERKGFNGAKRISGEHSRHGSAEKAKNEPPKEAVNHDSCVSLSGIEFQRAPKIERPDRHTQNPGEHSGRKENAKRFAADFSEGNSP